jgi:hypothetical protein
MKYSRTLNREGIMRHVIWCAVLLFACGQPEQKAVTPTGESVSATASSPPPAAEASAAPSASVAVVVAPVAPMKPLKELVAGAKNIKLVWIEDTSSNKGVVINIKTDATIRGLVTAIGGDQSPQGDVPGFMTTFAFTFEDADGKALATVGLCASATMGESMKKYGRLDLGNGTHAGIVVKDYADLQKKLKALGANLP